MVGPVFWLKLENFGSERQKSLFFVFFIHESIEKSPNWTKKFNFFENLDILLVFVNFYNLWKARGAKI